MPEFHVVRCVECSAFQVQQVKKAPRWACLRCGCKQTLLRAYAISDRAKDCRLIVMNLNTAQGEAQQEQALAQLGAVEALEQHELLHPHGEQQQRQQRRAEEQPALWGAVAEGAAASRVGGPRTHHAGGAGPAPAPRVAYAEYVSDGGGDCSGDQGDEGGDAGGVLTSLDGWAGPGTRGGRGRDTGGTGGGRRRAREEHASLGSPQQSARRWQGQQQGQQQGQEQGQQQQRQQQQGQQQQGRQQGQHWQQQQGQQQHGQQQQGQQRGQHWQQQGQEQRGRHQPQQGQLQHGLQQQGQQQGQHWQQQGQEQQGRQQQPGVPRTAAHVQPVRPTPWHAAPAQPARTTAPAPAPVPSTDAWAAAPQPRPQPLLAAGGGGGGGAGGQAQLQLPAHPPSRAAIKAPVRTSKWAAFVASDGEEGDDCGGESADQDSDGRRFCLAL
ncbi:hypothetical protein FOA52_009885 [Chlamydomonas sp. UWO 241]|nr:hypothetical protein FOA52_009885 [Chlamydomonas sp. UWO 241]